MTSKIPISFIFTVVISLMFPMVGRAIEVWVQAAEVGRTSIVVFQVV